MKTNIIEEIGEYNLLLPSLVKKASVAGDKSRYYLNLLRSAIDYADNPEKQRDSLSDLRIRVGIQTPKFDIIVCESAITGEGFYQIPYYGEIISEFSKSMQEMVSPFRYETYYSNPDLLRRTQSLLEDYIDADRQITLDDERINLLHEDYDGDNFYRLICEIEDILVILQDKMTPEDVYGATAYMIQSEDMFLIRSFMIGLNRTESLRFDHPGLATMVIRAGNSLLFQNKIGMTDEHMLVLHITDSIATVSYSDKNLNRLSFFQSLMNPYPILWTDIITKRYQKEDHCEIIHVVTGSFSSRSGEDLLMFISHLSSKIVFLIEWNRARKALKPFISGRDVVKVLQKSVKREVGHRAFLILGGERLILDALEDFSEISLNYGETLSDVLGSEHAIEFCISVLEISTQYVRQKHQRDLIREDIRAELMRQYISGREDLHQVYLEYAGNIKTMTSLFTRLTSTISDDTPINKDEILEQIRDCSVQLDSHLKRIRSKRSKETHNDTWISCISTVNNAMLLLSDATYLCTLIPQTSINTEIIRKISRLSESAEFASDILYHTIEEADLSPCCDEFEHKEVKQYIATITSIIISSDAIFRSVQNKMYSKENLENGGQLILEICRLTREALQMIVSGSTYLKGLYWHYQLYPELRISFEQCRTQEGQSV